MISVAEKTKIFGEYDKSFGGRSDLRSQTSSASVATQPN